MRTFIAIDIPEEIKDRIIEIQEQLPEFKGKKTERENFNLTLKFLGEVDKEKINEIKERLKRIKMKEFVAEVDSIGVFSEEFIRIIWIGIKNCDKLQKEIDNALVGLVEKERRFMGHLTIARVKSIQDKNRFLDELTNLKFESIEFNVKSFELKKSTLTEKGHTYETLESYNLN